MLWVSYSFSSQNTFVFTHHYVGHFIFIQDVVGKEYGETCESEIFSFYV